MKKYFPAFTLMFFTLSLFGFKNTGSISGTVFEAENQPAIYANVILKSVMDSSMVKGGITNDKGEFELLDVPYDDYFLSISYIGFANYDSEVFTLNAPTKTHPTISLKSANNELSEITVTAIRPILEMKADKVVFNVEGTINAAGENALDLLRKSPGVAIDNNENVSLLGKSGVRVFIDGKESQLSGDDLSAFLRSLQSDQLDAIEIITNPSAKYDAEGNAGIINIRMKKDKRNGTNAFLNAGYAKGKKQALNGSLSANHRNKWMNVFGKYSYSDWNGESFMTFQREQIGLPVTEKTLLFDNDSHTEYSSLANNYRFGADFFINDKSTIGFIVDGYVNDRTNDGNTTTELSTKEISVLDSVLIASTVGDGYSKNNNFNLNYKWDITQDQYFNVDLDYGKYSNESSDYAPNQYFTDFDKTALLSENIYRINTETVIDIATGKVDYERPLFSGKIGVGAKYASVKTDNDFDFYNVYNDIENLNVNRSNDFKYSENVLAAYVNYNGVHKKLTYQLGLRAENTDSKGELITLNGQDVPPTDRSYLDLFPSVSFSIPVDQKNNLQLSYSRRINRPTYQHLNPFVSQLDELIYEQGNERLNPEYTQNVQLRHSYNYFLTTTLAYSHTKNVISTILSKAPDGKASLYSFLNLASQDHYSINVAAPYTINKWWSTYSSLTGYYLHNKADYGEGNVVDFEVTTLNFYSQQTFQLPWSSSFEVSGWYSSPSVWEGNFATDDMWSIDVGFQKKFLNDRAKLKLSLGDVFKSQGWSGTSELGVMSLYGEGRWDSRRFRINFSYAFGNENVKSRKRNTGMEDENKRIESGGQ